MGLAPTSLNYCKILEHPADLEFEISKIATNKNSGGTRATSVFISRAGTGGEGHCEIHIHKTTSTRACHDSMYEDEDMRAWQHA